MRQASDNRRWHEAYSGRRGGLTRRLALPGRHTRRARGGFLLRRRARRRPVGPHRLALCRQVSYRLYMFIDDDRKFRLLREGRLLSSNLKLME